MSNELGQTAVIVSREDCEIEKTILTPGNYNCTLNEGSKCKVKITEIFCTNGRMEPTEVDKHSRYFKQDFDGNITVGEADSFMDIDFDLCLESMVKSEICLLKMVYYNTKKRMVQSLSCRVQVLDVQSENLVCDWDWKKLLEHAKKHKVCGVELIKQHRITDAFSQFHKGIKFIVAIYPLESDDVTKENIEDINDTRVKLYNNLAHCQLYYKEYNAALTLSSKVLEYDGENIKALYRRGSAYIGLEMWELAYLDIKAVFDKNPQDNVVVQKLNFLKPKVEKINKEYTAVIKKMFQ